MSEQAKSAADFSEMPPVETFETLDNKVQRDLIVKFSNQEQEADDKNSETSKENSEESIDSEEQAKDEESSEAEEEKAEESKDESDESDEEAESAESDKDNQEKKVIPEKQYKDLQSDYTKTKQLVKKLEEKISNLESKGEKKEAESQEETNTDSYEELNQLVKDNPKLEPLMKVIQKTIDKAANKIAGEKIKPIEKQLTQASDSNNESTFRQDVTKFLKSPLGKLEKELNVLLAEEYGDEDSVIKAARKDPNLFEKIEARLIKSNLKTVMNLGNSKNEKEDPTSRNQEINDLGVGKKSKKTKVDSDPLDINNFKELDESEMKKQLKKQGVWKD